MQPFWVTERINRERKQRKEKVLNILHTILGVTILLIGYVALNTFIWAVETYIK